MSERGRRGLPEEPVSSSLSEVRALLRDPPGSAESTKGVRRGAFGTRSDDAQGVGAELREVLSSAPSAAELEAERRARWAEDQPAVAAPKDRLGRGVLAVVVAGFVGAAGAAFWFFRQPADETGVPTPRAESAQVAKAPAPMTSPPSVAISAAPIAVAPAASAAASAPKSAAPATSKAQKKRPLRRNVDRQFDDVLDRL